MQCLVLSLKMPYGEILLRRIFSLTRARRLTLENLNSIMLISTLACLLKKRYFYTGDCAPIEIKDYETKILSTPNSTEIVCRALCCNCSNCMDLNFDSCSTSELSDNARDNAEEEFEEKEYEIYGH